MLPAGLMKRIILVVCLAAFLPSALPANAQYVEYATRDGKAQQLGIIKVPAWMTLDMELRSRTEVQTAISYKSGNQQEYDVERVRGGIELRPSSWLTGYMQFHDNHVPGLPAAFASSNMRDTFDLRQGFLQTHYKTLRLTAGRQELKFADERVVGISDWANNSRTFDGFDLHLGDRNRIDLFSASVVTVYPTSLDKHGAGLTFHGVEASIVTLFPKTRFAPFVLVRALPRVLSQQAIYGTETEVTFGTYVAGAFLRNFDYAATGMLQRGSYSNDSIHSGAGIVKAGYIAPFLLWKPRVQGEYDYATGNPHTNVQRIGTFDQQYPSNHDAFGLVDLFGFENIKQMRSNLSLRPSGKVTLLFQVGSLHLTTVRDNLYSSSGSTVIKAPSKGFASDGIGTEFDSSAKFTIRKYTLVNVGIAHFFPGEAMTSNSHGAPLTLAYFSAAYRFKIGE
jgi:hypothetical protein